MREHSRGSGGLFRVAVPALSQFVKLPAFRPRLHANGPGQRLEPLLWKKDRGASPGESRVCSPPALFSGRGPAGARDEPRLSRCCILASD